MKVWPCYYVTNITMWCSVTALLVWYCMVFYYPDTVLLMLLCDVTLPCYCATSVVICYNNTSYKRKQNQRKLTRDVSHPWYFPYMVVGVENNSLST